ncbi:hypothetical protein JD844_001295 [Phrynosoma platyrhinos]|uniref:VWFA domain-containing protein n=1 Tax=Phrynosoma platyrhinos TaxID=52577 RepID=A0ABQ7TA81_PHRPL|nr:hypothetical protein JD844_001295 [Phrynosoma platyrhinos]
MRVHLFPTVLVPQGCGFSVDVDTPTIFRVQTQSFGASVAQTRNMVLVGAPLQIGEVNEVVLNYISLYSFPECSAHPTDIVFLIDGSGSINGADFERMKQFVSEIIKRLSGRDTQFSDQYKEHFNFNSKDPAQLVMDISQIDGMTNTATAIRKVVRELFTSQKGSRKEATKILIVITDGEKSDNVQYWEVIPEAERAGIIRYAVGVGAAFSSSSAKQELNDIASEPDGEHVFTVYNFNALKGIQDQLQNKIFAIEGTKSQSSSSFQMEMSQEGFSALLTQEGPVIGAVGSYDWTGGVFLYQNSNRNPRFVNISNPAKSMDNAYLGKYENPTISTSCYILHVLQSLYVSTPEVGSYFGATLCSVDLDQDTSTDLVLVGAPMYYDGLTGGRVYICHFLEESLHCRTSLKGQVGHIFGRFGASMAEAGDITGDGWMDVAIGAPLEDENTGALYIFAGKQTTLHSQYIQRIEGLRFTGGFLYFGQTVSGGTDLTGDGLKDIVVGQQGQVLLMRSRPVLYMGVSIEFQPSLISTSLFKCQGQEPLEKVASEAKVCFTVSKATGDKLGVIVSDLQYNLALDSERTNIRASFSSKSSVLNASFQIGLEQKCQVHAIKLPLPFEKNCGSDGKCEDILQTSFTFSGLNTLIVGLTPELNVTASIQNHGEDSYSTTLRFYYPAGFSYRKVTLLQVNGTEEIQAPSKNVMSIKCHSAPVSEEQSSRNATCNVNHPIFWSGAQAIFVATFDVSPDAYLGDTLQIMAKANSVEESTKYVNFTAAQEGASKSVEHRYEVKGKVYDKNPFHFQVKNLRERSIPVSVTFQIPVKLKGIQVWDVSQVIPSEDCSVASCKTIRCDILLLGLQKQPLEFRIKGNLRFQWASQAQTVVERIENYNFLPVIIGSTVGGLVLLGLIAAALYKAGFFKRQYKQMLSDAGSGNEATEATNPTAQGPDSSPPDNAAY